MLELDRLLEEIDVEIAPFAICEVRRRARALLNPSDVATLHYVLDGRGTLRSGARAAIALAPHTVVVAPPGVELVVSCQGRPDSTSSRARCQALPGGWQRLVYGAGAHGLVLACGTIDARHRQALGLFDFLDAPLVEDMSEASAFRDAFRLLLDELAAPSAGTVALARVLMKQCLIMFVRRQCADRGGAPVWLVALDHPKLGEVLTVMLAKPETPFTLAGLADLANMSRAAFAERFKATFGHPPMSFLREARLRRAERLLSTTDLPVKTIADRVGYKSRSHFSRTFKAFAGIDPARYRARGQRSGMS